LLRVESAVVMEPFSELSVPTSAPRQKARRPLTAGGQLATLLPVEVQVCVDDYVDSAKVDVLRAFPARYGLVLDVDPEQTDPRRGLTLSAARRGRP
jgi:hypothetical protein